MGACLFYVSWVLSLFFCWKMIFGFILLWPDWFLVHYIYHFIFWLSYSLQTLIQKINLIKNKICLILPKHIWCQKISTNGNSANLNNKFSSRFFHIFAKFFSFFFRSPFESKDDVRENVHNFPDVIQFHLFSDRKNERPLESLIMSHKKNISLADLPLSARFDKKFSEDFRVFFMSFGIGVNHIGKVPGPILHGRKRKNWTFRQIPSSDFLSAA